MAVIEAVGVNSAATVKERLEEFGREVLAEAMNRPDRWSAAASGSTLSTLGPTDSVSAGR